MTRKYWFVLAIVVLLIVAAIALTRQQGRDGSATIASDAPNPQGAGTQWGNYEMLSTLHIEALRKLKALELRDSVLPAVRSRVSPAHPFDFVLIGSAAAPELQGRLGSALTERWRALAITQPRFPVVAVMAVDTIRRRANSNAATEQPGSQVAFALPSRGSTEPCVSVLRIMLPERQRIAYLPIEQRVGGVPGVCAYYAAFGEPGAAIQEWLASREFDLARGSDWTGSLQLVPGAERAIDYGSVHPLTNWLNLRSGNQKTSTTFLRCSDGEREACAQLVLDSILRIERGRTRADRPLIEGAPPDTAALPFGLSWNSVVIDEFLAGLLRNQGRDRFQRFWQSDQPPAAAFQEAFGQSIDGWTADWVRYVVGPTKRATRTGPLTLFVTAAFVAASLAIAFQIAARRNAG